MESPRFRPRPPRRERLALGQAFPRHRHAGGYATIILTGGFEEAGDFGRRTVRPGDVLVRPAFSAHVNRSVRDGEALNLPLPLAVQVEARHARLDDPDALVRESERDPSAALDLFFRSIRLLQPLPADWPDQLADALNTDGRTNLEGWAKANRLHAAGLARGFRQLYDTTPARYRADQRARRAWERLVGSDESLTAIAYDLGFADQAHMCRAVRALTGRPPVRWRGLRKFKT